MASPAYEQILRVQGLDLSLLQLNHRHKNHPARDDIAAADADTAVLDGEIADVDGRIHELERQRKRLEDEASSIKGKRLDIDGKLYGGEITASKELLALQDEAAMLLGKQTELEDQELELMEALEGVDVERTGMIEQRGKLETRRSDLESELKQGLADIDEEAQATVAERSEAVVGADATLLSTYESLRGQYDGVAVARLANGGCDGCHIHLSAVAVDLMGKMPEDAVVTCEECGRLLVR